MVFERYYIDLLDLLNSLSKKIASGKYDQKDVDKLTELSKTGKYPGLFTELAESFSMMMVKVEAREFRLQQIIEELKETKTRLEEYSQSLERKLSQLKEKQDKASADD